MKAEVKQQLRQPFTTSFATRQQSQWPTWKKCVHVSSPQGSLIVFRGLKVLRDLQSLGACITFRGNAVSRGLLCGNAVSRCLEVSLGVLV